MSKYVALSRHLERLSVSRWDATFDEIEEILGFPLPASARMYNPWWANQSGGGHSQKDAWQSVGWRTENVRPAEGRVTFVRLPREPSRYRGLPDAIEETAVSEVAGLTIAEAKAGLARQFGVPQDRIEILIKG